MLRSARVLLAVVLLASPAAVASPWRKIVAEGEAPLQGLPYGSLILASRIADDGTVSFADVSSNPLANPPRYSLWRWSAASGADFVATGEAPSGSGAWVLPELFSNGGGDVAVREGRMRSLVDCGSGATSEQVRERLQVVPSGGDPTLAAATGAPAPGASLLTIARLIQTVSGGGFGRPLFVSHFAPPSLDPGGALTFYAHTADDPCFLDAAGAILPGAVFAPDDMGGGALVTRDGDPLPGASDGEVVRIESFERVAAAGAVFVSSWLGEIEREEPRPAALLRWRPGVLETVVRPGEPAAFAGGATFADVGAPASSPSGRIAFVAKRAAEDGTTPDPAGLGVWTGDAEGVLESWPLAGAVPGGPEGAAFVEATAESALPSGIRVNDAGEVAFVAEYRTTPEAEASVGLFGPDANGAPILRLAVGASAPGGRTFLWFEPLHLAEDGTVLVWAGLSVAPGVCCRSSDFSWFLLPREGAPRLLLRQTDELEIAPGDRRRVGSTRMAHDAALTRFGMVFGTRFGLSPEPTAIAVRTVPEPCASLAGAGAFAALGLLASRRRARRPIRTGCRPRSSRVS